MKAILLDVPQSLLDARHRLGHDRSDEMWDGVLHMVPPASGEHQERGSALIAILRTLAKRVGLQATYETGLFERGRDDNYRVPDNVVSRPEHRTSRGVEGRAELVVEFRSPNDESYEKLPFYALLDVEEVAILDGSSIDLRCLVEGSYEPVLPDDAGWFHLTCVPLALRSANDGLIEARSNTGTELL